MSDQAESELAAFRHFIEVAGLDVLPESIVKRDPPEPDVRCRLASGEVIAFELVEVCNQTNARSMFSAQQVHEAIVFAYENLPRELREAFDRRFISRPLSFYFRPQASLSLVRNTLGSLLTELGSASLSGEGFTSFSEAVGRVVAGVRLAGRLDDPGSVNFNIGGQFDPTVPLDAISAKLAKEYATDCPVELLAHFGGFACGHDSSYREAFTRLLSNRDLGPFRRVWVVDWAGVGLVFPGES